MHLNVSLQFWVLIRLPTVGCHLLEIAFACLAIFYLCTLLNNVLRDDFSVNLPVLTAAIFFFFVDF